MATKPVTQQQQASQQTAIERPYLSSAEAWDKAAGPEFGGQADILQIQVGEVAGPFEYSGHQPMNLEGNKQVTVHLGVGPDNEILRLPISASFLRAVDQAELIKGDKFLIRRANDVAKKAGVGKGTMMPIYAIKPTFRVAERPKPGEAPF